MANVVVIVLRAILRLKNDPELRRSMGEKGHKTVCNKSINYVSNASFAPQINT